MPTDSGLDVDKPTPRRLTDLVLLGIRFAASYTALMKIARSLIAALVCMVGMQVWGHWQWLDKDGHKVFSDRPPPPGVAEKDILQRPSVNLTSTAPPTSASSPRPSGIDKELADKKKKADDAEIAMHRAEEERIASIKAENCARAKRAKASFDSGRRIAQANDKGEPVILDAAARAEEVKRLQAVIDSDCN